MGDQTRFDRSRLVQDAVIRNLQTLAESSQRLSAEFKNTKPEISWRELSGFRNVIVSGNLGVSSFEFAATRRVPAGLWRCHLTLRVRSRA